MSLAITASDPRLASRLDDYEAVTENSGKIRKAWAEKRNYLQGSASDWFPLLGVTLHSIADGCTFPGWDGAGSRAVSHSAITTSAHILEALFTMLPRGTPAPDLIPEADGEICISWSAHAGRVLSISVGEHGRINFAGQFGKGGNVHAWQPIDTTSRSSLGESLQDVARYVSRLYAPATFGRSAG